MTADQRRPAARRGREGKQVHRLEQWEGRDQQKIENARAAAENEIKAREHTGECAPKCEARPRIALP